MKVLSQSKYAQKSKLFLLPLIEVKRRRQKNTSIRPLGPFIRDDKFTEEDFRLILPFERDETADFYHYEKELTSSPYFDVDNYYETKDHQVYVYNLSDFKEDYVKVLYGQYTEMSPRTKGLINMYWGRIKDNLFEKHYQIEAYLNPTREIYEQFSQELEIPLKVLINTKELLNPPDIEKETFKVERRISKVDSRGEDASEIPCL